MSRIKCVFLFFAIFPVYVSAQEYLSEDMERNIKLSGRYYWKEGLDFDMGKAYSFAIDKLTEKIISEVVYQTKRREEVLKELEMKAQIGLKKQEGMVCVLAWIAKDSVFVTTQRQLNDRQALTNTVSVSTGKDSVCNTDVVNNINNVKKKSYDIVLQELMCCKNISDVNKVANRRGLVKGAFNSSTGFNKPEQCYIAVFDSKRTLIALLNKGETSRVELLSGQQIQDAESFYRHKGYDLWYLLKK